MWVCGRSLAGIAGSNPAGYFDVRHECCVLYTQRSLRLADHLSREFLQIFVRLSARITVYTYIR